MHNLSRRVAITGLCAAVAVPVAVSPASAADAELIALGKQFDKAAAELARIQRQNSEAHRAAEEATPLPDSLLVTDADSKLGIPPPLYPPGNYGHCLDWDGLAKINHPRARQIEAEYHKWRSDHAAALEFYGYSDDHPDMLAAYDALDPIEDAICRLPAQTIAGLHVKARVAFNSEVGEIGFCEGDDGPDAAYKSIARDLMRMQGIVGIETDHEFVKQDPFGKLAARA
jgi:hypothetical protein